MPKRYARTSRPAPLPRKNGKRKAEDSILLHKDRTWSLSFERAEDGQPQATLRLPEPALESTDRIRTQVYKELRRIFDEDNRFSLGEDEPRMEIPKSVVVCTDNCIVVSSSKPERVAAFLSHAAKHAPKDFHIKVKVDDTLMETNAADTMVLFAPLVPNCEFKKLLNDCGIDQSIAKLIQPQSTGDNALRKRVAYLKGHYGAEMEIDR